jgi:HEAT repeat protein
VKAKALGQNLGLAAATSLVFVGGLELLARAFDRPPPAAAPWADYIWDWREKMSGDFYVIRSEAVGWPPWEEINADGLRDRTHPEERPPGRARLVALGDSVTLGAGIEPVEAYPQRLEALLRREGRLVDVMNVGLWGWSTRQERLAYERIVRRYRPDRVVLGVCLNDLPELQNNLARPPEWLAALFRGSALVRRLVNAPGREIQNVEQLFEQAEAPRVREAYARFFAEVGELRELVRKDGAAFGVAVFPFRFQVLPGAPAPLAQRAIADYCRREGIAFLDLLPALLPLGDAGFVDYDHLSAKGAMRVAEEIAASELVPRSPNQREVLAARHPAGPPDLVAALRDGDDQVRVAATWALEQAAAETSRPGGNTLAGESAVDAARLVEALRKALRDPSPSVRSGAARALGALGQAAAAATASLFEGLGDGVQDVRWQAALALSRIGLEAPAAVKPLARALGSDDPYVRGFAAWSLGNLGQAAADAVPALVAALARDDGYGRGGAAAALARMGPAAAAAVPALLEGLRSPDGDRRWKAARTLGRLGPAAREAMPFLAEALRDPNEHVRRHAARALGRLGPLSPQAAAALQRTTGDPDAEVRKEATAALAAGR